MKNHSVFDYEFWDLLSEGKKGLDIFFALLFLLKEIPSSSERTENIKKVIEKIENPELKKKISKIIQLLID